MITTTLSVWPTEPPSTSVTAEQPALEGRESTILTCSAHGGRPDTHNLTWTKDDVVLVRGRGTTLNYNALYSFPNPFGRYVCSVESLYSSEEKSVLIKEKGIGNCYDAATSELWQFGFKDLANMLESSFILGPFHSVNVHVDHECLHTMNPYLMTPDVLSGVVQTIHQLFLMFL